MIPKKRPVQPKGRKADERIRHILGGIMGVGEARLRGSRRPPNQNL